MGYIKLIVCFFILISTIQARTIVFLGDSLTSGYDISTKHSFPAIIEKKVASDSITIINAGVPGDTTNDLLERLQIVIKNTKPDTVFICIGANDGLRGYKTTLIESNLQQIINILNSHNILIVLAGMKLPNYSPPIYRKSFESIFKRISDKNQLIFYPFLLQDVAMNKELNIQDQMHPNEKGHQVIATNIFEFLVTNNIILK